jgi:transposase
MWYAGIDWADEHHEVVVIDEQGQRVATCRVPHTPEGLAEPTVFLHQTLGAAPAPQELACLIETTHGLLITALLDAGLAVYPVNPTTVDRRRKPSGAKTDAIDAYLLAKTGRSDLADLRRLAPRAPWSTNSRR